MSIFGDENEIGILVESSLRKMKGVYTVNNILSMYSISKADLIDLILTLNPLQDVPTVNTALGRDETINVLSVLENDVLSRDVRRL